MAGDRVSTYRGKRLDYMTRQELIAAVEELGTSFNSLLKDRLMSIRVDVPYSAGRAGGHYPQSGVR